MQPCNILIRSRSATKDPEMERMHSSLWTKECLDAWEHGVFAQGKVVVIKTREGTEIESVIISKRPLLEGVPAHQAGVW